MHLHVKQYEVAPGTPSVLAAAWVFCNAAAWLDVPVAKTAANDICLVSGVLAVLPW